MQDLIRKIAELEIQLEAMRTIEIPSPSGWTGIGMTLTYASPTTFTVAGDYTSLFITGTKIKLTQTTVKYFYVVSSSYSSPNTTVTITGGSDYILAIAAITSPAYSYAAVARGFPDWFNASISGAVGWSTLPSSFVYRFSIVGRKCNLIIYTDIGTSNNSNTTLVLPVPAAGSGTSAAAFQYVDNGARPSTSGLAIAQGSSLLFFTHWAFALWSSTGGKGIDRCEIFYEI